VLRLLVTAYVPGSQILFNLMMEAIVSSETSLLTRATLRNIPEEGILQFPEDCLYEMIPIEFTASGTNSDSE
jgi:hypothetical protein